MGRGSVETSPTGFRARVYAGTDPITGRQTYLSGETRRIRRDAEVDIERLLVQVEALAEQLTEAVAALTTSEARVRMLRVVALFTRYSPSNVLLLWMQAEQHGVSPRSPGTGRGRAWVGRSSRERGRSQ